MLNYSGTVSGILQQSWPNDSQTSSVTHTVRTELSIRHHLTLPYHSASTDVMNKNANYHKRIMHPPMQSILGVNYW